MYITFNMNLKVHRLVQRTHHWVLLWSFQSDLHATDSFFKILFVAVPLLVPTSPKLYIFLAFTRYTSLY
jgi:hypothetical protein